jgi:hypothetical protein
MAGKKEVKRTEEVREEIPVFTLRADRVGHLRALIAALAELGDPEAAKIIREFDLWEESHR